MKFIFPVFAFAVFALAGIAKAQTNAPAPKPSAPKPSVQRPATTTATTNAAPKPATSAASGRQAAAAAAGKPAAPPVSSEPAITTAEFGGWVVRCVRLEGGSEQKLCEALQSVVIEGQNRPLTRIALARGKAANETMVTIIVPHDLTLATPPRIVLNNREQSAELRWSKCLPIGCLADATVPSAVVAKWRNETENGFLSITSGDGKPVDVPVSFSGLSQALDYLAKAGI